MKPEKQPETLPRGIQRRGDVLYAYLTHPNGKPEVRSLKAGTTVKMAVSQREIWLREIAESRYIKKAPRVERLLLETICDKFLEHAKSYHRFWDSTGSRIKRIKEWKDADGKPWGKLPADSITSRMIDAQLLANLAPRGLCWNETTSNEYRCTLYSIFKHAELGFNPAKEAKRYKLDNARTRELSEEEEGRLRAAIREFYPDKEPELDLALHTGVRHSNLYGTRGSKRRLMEPLQWSAVNLDLKVIDLPRTKKGKYTVPLNTVALAALDALRERSDGIGAVIRKPSGLEIYSSRKWFAACLKKAAIQGLCWHDLRHSFGTRLRRNRVPFEDIAALLGHGFGKASMTARYAHADMDRLFEAVATLVPKPPTVMVPQTQTVKKTVKAKVTEIRQRRTA
jgi:integrase